MFIKKDLEKRRVFIIIVYFCFILVGNLLFDLREDGCIVNVFRLRRE